jgi:hypothetical protein
MNTILKRAFFISFPLVFFMPAAFGQMDADTIHPGDCTPGHHGIALQDHTTRAGNLNIRNEKLGVTKSTQDSRSLAELYLARVAEEARGRREISGVGSLIVGSGIGALGAVMANSNDKSTITGEKGEDHVIGQILIGTGLAIDGVGIWALIGRSSGERELAKLEAVADPDQREHMAQESLESLAKDARISRILPGAFLFATSAWAFSDFVSFENKHEGLLILGVLSAVGGIYYHAVKSPEEGALESYEREKEMEQERGLGFYLGADRHSDLKIGFVYSF